MNHIISTRDDLRRTCVEIAERVPQLNDPRQNPEIFDEIARALVTEQSIAGAIWQMHLSSVETLARQTERLDPDVALAGRVIRDAVSTHPKALDQDGRFFFMACYLSTALHRIWGEAPENQRKIIPLEIARDLIFAPTQGKLFALQELMNTPEPANNWPGTATYPPENPIYINMMLAHIDTALDPDMDDERGEACLAMARAVRDFFVNPTSHDQSGMLLDGADSLQPSDLRWAWEKDGRAFLDFVKTGFPDTIWEAYRTGLRHART